MRNYAKQLIFLFILYSNSILAYNISGRLIDCKDKQAISGAYVLIKIDSVNTVSHTQTNDQGTFFIENISHSNFIVDISCLGYANTKIAISDIIQNIELGDICLNPRDMVLGEVIVRGESVIEKASHYVIIPSVQELGRARETLSLLSELKTKMPGLNINEALQKVTIDGGVPVFQINGKEQSLQKVLSLNQQNILRIDYQNTTDIRYADRGASGVINFVMKPSSNGGSIYTSINNALTTWKNNALVNASFYHNKSEWNLNYNYMWRKSRKEYTNSYEEFIGREQPIIREKIGLPSKTKDFDNNINLEYNYLHSTKTMFSISAGLRQHDNNHAEYNKVYESIENIDKVYNRNYNNQYQALRPTFDSYFRKALKDNQLMELTCNGAVSKGDYRRYLNYSTSFSQENNTRNMSWMGSVEGLYTILFRRFTTKLGFNYLHNYAYNEYEENDEREKMDELRKNNLYLYASIAGKLNKLNYSLGIGSKFFKSSDQKMSKSYVRAKTTLTLNYPISKHFNVNYLFMYDPSLPPLSSFSEIIQTIDDISVQTGNVKLKPSVWTRNRIYLKFNKSNFSATGWLSYSHTKDPIVKTYHYVADRTSPYYDKFMGVNGNGQYDERVNVALDLGYQNLFNHITLSGTIGWDQYKISTPGYSGRDNRIYGSLSLNAYWNNWSLVINYAIKPIYSLSGVTFSSDVRYDYLGLRYKLNQWSFGCNVINPFTKKGFYQKTVTYSEVNPSRTEFYIKDFANLVELSIQYRVNFGKGFNKSNRSLQKGTFDSGVNIEY